MDPFSFEYQFVLPPGTIERKENPFKMVKKEYLNVTWESFVGNVGGILGMFVGFAIKHNIPHKTGKKVVENDI